MGKGCLNLDEKFDEEVKEFELALYGKKSLIFKGGETKGLIHEGEIEFLSLPKNPEDFEKDISKVYNSLARYAEKPCLAIEKFANQLGKIDFASFEGREFPARKEEVKGKDLIDFAKYFNEKIIPPWDFPEINSKIENENKKVGSISLWL